MNEEVKIAVGALESLAKRGNIHVVGRTSYCTAYATDLVLRCDREAMSFLENKLTDKNNHVVLIFQVLWGDNGRVEGTYYAHLSDLWCNIGREIVYERL